MSHVSTSTKGKTSIKGLSKKLLKALYMDMLRPRMIEEKMLSLLRQGKISKWFSGIGQEAISVAATKILKDDEWIFPMHRNLGVFTTRDIPLHRLFAQWQGKPAGFTNGRDRSFHFGTKEYRIWGMISHLGPQLSCASGVALAHKLKKEKNLSVVFTGEGGTSEGEFHEALNVASVWQLPVMFIIENNGYGLSTPVSEQYNCKHLADRGIGYGMEAHTLDGNNVTELYTTLDKLAKSIRRKPRPILIECMTFRMRGHEEASGTKYVPKKLMEHWAEKDPINNLEEKLIDKGIIDEAYIEKTKREIKAEIESELKKSYTSPELEVDLIKETKEIFSQNVVASSEEKTGGNSKEMRFIDAVSDGLDVSMKKWDDLILMGQDIADYGGVFKITDGFTKKYGKDRVRNTPLCESAIIGIALGLSMKNHKSMVEMQFSDFATCGFNQIVNNLAKIHYRWGHPADVVVRMPCGGGVGAGPFHSQTNEAWFAHTPGLKVVYPSNPTDAKGLLLAALEDSDPVIYFEHKAMYRTLTEKVAEGYFTTPLGKAAYASEGNKLSIITYGMGVHWAMEAISELGISADIIDLRSLQPLDTDTIAESVIKTNKVIILHEDNLFGGFGGELSAYISEHLFEHLDAPIKRVASLDTPVPFNGKLEAQFLPKERLRTAIKDIIKY